MTERRPIYPDRLSPTESGLTAQPRPSKLERRGDILMPDGPRGGEIPQSPREVGADTVPQKKPDVRGAVIREGLRRTVFRKKPENEVSQESQDKSRSAWEEFYRGKKMLPGEHQIVEAIIKEGGMPNGIVPQPETDRQQVRVGQTTWRSWEGDRPISVTGYIGKGPDGRDYISIEGSATGIPLDEIEYTEQPSGSGGGGGQEPPAPPNGSPLESEESDGHNEQEKTKETLIEMVNNTKEEILFNIFEIGVDKMSAEDAREFILQTNKAIGEVLTEDLPQASRDRYKDALKHLEGLSAEEARTEYKNTLENIRKERKQAGLEQPLVKEALERFKKNEPEVSPISIDPGNGDSDKTNSTTHSDEEVSGTAPAENEDKDPFENMMEDIVRINKLGDDLGKNKGLIDELKRSQDLPGVIGEIYSANVDSEARAEASRSLELILNGDPSSVKENLTGFIRKLKKDYEEIKGKEKKTAVDEYRINSIQGLARVIASKTNSELYGPTGEHKLIDEKGKFYPENFVLWVREQAVRLHEDNRNTEMYPLSAIVLSTGYRDISLYMMTRTNREQYFRDQDSGIVMDDLADELINEAFYFGVYRNTNLAYFQVMGQDEELPKAVVQFHARNDLTSGDGLEKMLSAPGDFSEKETDTKVGDAIRIANDIYYNLSDYEELGKIFGADPLKGEKPLTIIDIENALRIIQKKKDWSGDNDDEKLENFDSFDKNTRNEFHYDASSHTLRGKYSDKDTKKEKEVNLLLGNGIIDLKEFVRFMNIYNYATPLANRVDLLREIIKIKVAEKTGLEAGIALTAEEKQVKKDKWEKDKKARGDKEADRIFMAKRKSERININYAETSSYVMQRPIGAAAQNDTGRIGFDAATKLFMKDYLIRQSGEDTTGPIGVPDEIGIFNALSTDLWTGLRTESGDSPYEIFMRLRDIDNDKELSPEAKRELKKEQIGKLRFKERAESDFAANQISRAFQILHAQLGAEQLDLNKIVTFDLMQGIRYNPKEFEDQIKEKFIKPMRYAFSSNSALKYSSQVRIYDLENDPERKRKSYRTGSLAEKMFGPEVLDGMLIDQEGNPLNESYYDTSQGRVELMKHAARARVAAQLRYHRKFRSVGERWTFMRTETFLMALQTLKEVEEDEAHPGRVKETNKGFFSKEDIAWIRENSGSEVLRMVMIDSIADGGKNLPAGLFDALVKLVQGIAKG